MTAGESSVTANIFRRLLPALWLRPERALWDAHELATVRGLLPKEIEGPSLEYGCTEGTNTFVMLGGEFDLAYDDYDGVLQGMRDSRADNTGDYFAFSPIHLQQAIATPADTQFSIGVSWKQAHLERSQALGVYKELHLAPIGDPLREFADQSFKTIWAPNLFWSDSQSLASLVTEQRRLLHPDGKLITIFPGPEQRHHTLLERAIDDNLSWLEFLDRGKYLHLTQHARSHSEWVTFFSRCNLRVTQTRTFLPAIVGHIYEVGLRPIFPALLEARELLLTLPKPDFLSFKKHWIDVLCNYLVPLCRQELPKSIGSEQLWFAFELERI
jgi:hypothetical protein